MQPDEQPDDQVLRAALLNVKLPMGMQQRLRDRLRAEAAQAAPQPEAGLTQTDLLVEHSAAHQTQAQAQAIDAGLANETSSAQAELRETEFPKTEFPETELPEIEMIRPAQPQTDRELPLRSKRTRRSVWATALALCIVALAGLGLYQWTRPVSNTQLAQFTLSQLDRLLSEEVAWQTDFDPQLPELAVLQGQLRSNIRPVGFQDQSGGPVADQYRVWKLYSLTTHKVFFVFDFQQAKPLPSLTRQLQELSRSSGGWSVVAMQADGRVVVVAVEGRVDSYLYQLQSA